jgi:poly-gamma-glutamate capsule biosynthesis protein CapA/YwtB (metallophosphatase superfamily)
MNGLRFAARACLLCVTALLLGGVGTGAAGELPAGPADPVARDPGLFDPARPISRELQANVPDGFTVAAVGDLIISRPVSQYAARLPAFRSVLDVLGRANAVYGNLETVIFDARTFTGAPYSWDGDWTVSSVPAVARDLRAMGFTMVSRANNHALDFGLEGMRETSRWLDEAGIMYAGSGETHGLARAPQFLETRAGRVALVSIASTFRPTTESLPPSGPTPGRPGISALHLRVTVNVPPKAAAALAEAQCQLRPASCGKQQPEGELFGTKYRAGQEYSYEYAMDDADLAEIYRSIRSAKENSDFVVVSIHAHECSLDCDDDSQPRGPGNFLKQLAHGAIDSGADMFVVTGNHNLGPIEIYRSPARGARPIFYGLGNFFWSDVQALLPHDLIEGNHTLLAAAWQDPGKATDYDLTAPLNRASFAHAFTFQTVLASCRFDGRQLSRVELHPIELGYGSVLTESGIPRVATDATTAAAIFRQVVDRTARFGLPKLNIEYSQGMAIIRP